LRGLAWTHAQEGDWPAAVALFERVLTLEEARLGPQSADLAPILGELQQALLSAGRADEGTHYGQRATQLLKAVHGPEDPRVAGAEIAWAETTLASGDPATALALSRHGLGILLATRGLTDAGALVALVNIGTACLALDENEEAVAAFEHADKVAKAAGVSPGRRTSAQLGLATALWRTGKRSQATTLARDVYRTLEGGDATAAVSIEDVEAWLQRRHLSP
jgi:tetratricopeptide (TPR) repeat protein